MLPDDLATPGAALSFEAMPIAMDIASGITAARKAHVIEQAKTAIIGPYLDYALHFDGLAPELDLGDAFRRNPESSIPVLVLSGTLDGRTFIGSQREAVAGLKNVTVISVNNAGHNLFDVDSDELQATIDRFMRGASGSSLGASLTVELPNLAPSHQPD